MTEPDDERWVQTGSDFVLAHVLWQSNRNHGLNLVIAVREHANVLSGRADFRTNDSVSTGALMIGSRWALAAFVLTLSGCASSGNDISIAHSSWAADPATSTSFAATPFYVDFRTRPYSAITHIFLVYGAQDSGGHPLERKTVGFFPYGGYLGPFIGIVAIGGEVAAEDYYANLPSSTTFRRDLTAEQYERLTRYIDSERAKPHIYNLVFNNCNDFVAGAADAIGLKVPFLHVLPPPLFVMLLARMNS
jgi:hypothetical protein